jgi:hypothetical protein
MTAVTVVAHRRGGRCSLAPTRRSRRPGWLPRQTLLEDLIPKRKPPTIGTLPPLGLADAIHRLITDGKTTAPEGLRLAADRAQRIAALKRRSGHAQHRCPAGTMACFWVDDREQKIPRRGRP